MPSLTGSRHEPGPAAAPRASGAGRVLVVDPAAFSLPYDHSLCDALQGAGWDVTLAFGGTDAGPVARGTYERWNNFRPPEWARKGPRVVSRALKSVQHASAMRALVARVRQAPPDVVHFQWLPLPLVDGVAVRRLKGRAPLVLTLHNTTIFHGSPTSRLQGLGFERAVRDFDHLVVHTEYSRQRVLEQGWAGPDGVTVIPHGVLDYYRALRRPGTPVARTPGERVVLFFGSLKPYKGVDVLLEAFARLPERTRDTTRLLIAGQPGMDMAPLRALADARGIAGRVEWRLGHVDERDVAGLLEGADVVALPYREIDQSGVLLTAVAFRRPIVATRVGGIPETVPDGSHALLAEPGDAAGLADRLARLLEDDALRARFTAALESLATGPLAWADIAARTAELYRRLAARQASRA